MNDGTRAARLDKSWRTVANLLRLRVPADIIHWRTCPREHRQSYRTTNCLPAAVIDPRSFVVRLSIDSSKILSRIPCLEVARKFIDAIVLPCRALLAGYFKCSAVAFNYSNSVILGRYRDAVMQKLKARVTHRRYDDRINRANRRELVLQFCCSRLIR